MKNNLLNKFTIQLKKEFTKKETFTGSVLKEFQFKIADAPAIIEKRYKDWIYWGEDNLYPLSLDEYTNGSAIHGSILKTKIKMMHGDGFLWNGAKTKEESDAVYASLAPNVKAELDFLLKNKFGGMSLIEVTKKLSKDYQRRGQMCYEIVFNTDFTKIVTVKYVDAKNIRAGKTEDGIVKTYYYHNDWTQQGKGGFKPKEIPAYFEGNKESYNQLVFIKTGDLDYYGEPSYKDALYWIATDVQMGIFHNANMNNGMNPGLHFNFFKLPDSQNQEDEIIAGIEKTWGGAKNTGKKVVTFSDGKENAMEIKPIEVSNLDKQLLLVAELCDKKILSGHQLTSPLLAGISVSGQLGGNTELQTAYEIFDKVSMEADRQMLSDSLQMILDYNKIPVTIDINPFKPFVNG